MKDLEKLKDHELINLYASLEYLQSTHFRKRNYALQRNFTARSWEYTGLNSCVIARDKFDLEFSEEQIKKFAKRMKNVSKILREVESELEKRGIF